MINSPFPSGWFAIAFSKELKKGKILSKTFMGQEIVLFRTDVGTASALDAYCPHLGAHLGHGGKVVNGCIQCPFHHLKFTTTGQCTSAKHIKTKSWLLEERDGLIFLYHGDPKKMHELPHLTQTGWEHRNHRSKKIRGRLQETLENTVDLTHFSSVHRNALSVTIHKVSAKDIFEGETQVEITQSFFGKSWKFPPLYTSLRIFGLGYYLIQGSWPKLGIEIALLTIPAPIDENHLSYKICLFTKPIPSSSSIFRIVTPLISYTVFKHLWKFIRQDLSIWHHQRHLDHPLLTTNDNFIHQLRKWTRKFYE